eukprot:Hpha_TRINITY_DN309_c0_g1::TRINITY_DN309_c0_g1_i1::g.112642::m.112642
MARTRTSAKKAEKRAAKMVGRGRAGGQEKLEKAEFELVVALKAGSEEEAEAWVSKGADLKRVYKYMLYNISDEWISEWPGWIPVEALRFLEGKGVVLSNISMQR